MVTFYIHSLFQNTLKVVLFIVWQIDFKKKKIDDN